MTANFDSEDDGDIDDDGERHDDSTISFNAEGRNASGEAPWSVG